MLRMIGGLVAGTIFTAILFMGPLSPSPVAGESDNSTQTPDAETYREAVSTLFREAGNQIQDSDIHGYYQKLQQEYALDQESSWIVPAEDSSPEAILPDIEKINHTALTLPLEEAGKNIKDEDIARFYYKLLNDAGWQIESN